MYDPVSKQPGWRETPQSPLGWHQKWTDELRIDVPGKHGSLVGLELAEIRVAEVADLFVIAKDGREFYVSFQRGPVFRATDKPLLIFPPHAPAKAIWVLPAD